MQVHAEKCSNVSWSRRRARAHLTINFVETVKTNNKILVLVVTNNLLNEQL